MIWVTRLNGTEIVVNADLIETVESTPDTVLTLVDGKKYVIHEPAAEVVRRIQNYRASILTMIDGPLEPVTAPPKGEAALYVLPQADPGAGAEG